MATKFCVMLPSIETVCYAVLHRGFFVMLSCTEVLLSYIDIVCYVVLEYNLCVMLSCIEVVCYAVRYIHSVLFCSA